MLTINSGSIKYNQLNNAVDKFNSVLSKCFKTPNNTSILVAYTVFAKAYEQAVSQFQIEKDTDLAEFQKKLIDLMKPILEKYVLVSEEIVIKEIQRNFYENVSIMYSNYYINYNDALYKVLENRCVIALTIRGMSLVGHSHFIDESELKNIQNFDDKHLDYCLLTLQRLYDLDSALAKDDYGDCFILNELAKIPKVKEYFQLPDTSNRLTWDDWVKAILSQKHKLYYDEE